MKPEQYLQEIFAREIARLHALSQQGKLDMADIKKLESLVTAYSKFKPHDFGDEGGDLPDISTEDLLKAAK